jgi:hypothetical protein
MNCFLCCCGSGWHGWTPCVCSLWLESFKLSNAHFWPYCELQRSDTVRAARAVTCAEITIVLCYFQLCSEDYHWWWRSYFTAGSSALYLFLYSAFYFYTKLDITKTVPMLMYFGYMLVISFGFFCVTGTIGFYACYLFVRTIYAAVKID